MKKIFISVIIFVLIAFIAVYFTTFKANFNTDKDKTYFYIPKNTKINTVKHDLQKNGYLKNYFTFALLSKFYKPTDSIKTGAYLITPAMSNIRFLNKIYKREQSPIKLKINNIRLKSQLASKISKQLNIDSLELLNRLNDNIFLQKYDLTKENVLTVFIPNTYEVYWTISTEQFFDKMKNEHGKFWNTERLKKAEQIPLSPVDVEILASIVDEETNKSYEKPIIAGLYINRLKIGMPLQADPTARYALGDFSINQVLNSYTKIKSPYNTYLNKGLPPGPIRIASIEGIDAVLNYQKHNYLYMCAKPELNGEHNFTDSYAKHQKYANDYYKALKEWKLKNSH